MKVLESYLFEDKVQLGFSNKWEMAKRNAENEKMKKVYREYARIKFRKYKLQFPRLRESEIVTQILREWEELDQESKQNLQKEFTARGSKAFLALSSSSQSDKKKKKGKSEDHPSKKSDPQKKKSSPKVRVFEQKNKVSPKKLLEEAGIKDSSDFKKSDDGKQIKGSSSTPDKKKDSSSSLLYTKKTKKIAKKENKALRRKKQMSEYASFQKYYTERLTAQHPRWNKHQVQTIVRLLWRKKRTQIRRRNSFSKKAVSGRQLYRREKQSQGLLREQIKMMWKSLPHESKIYWNIRGGKRRIHRSQKATSANVRKILNSGATGSERSNIVSFGWMQKPIK